MRTVRAIAALAALALAQGCTTNCNELADRICGCLPPGTLQTACKDQVKAQLKRDPKPDSAAEAYCDSKLATCPGDQAMCDALNTCQGKVNCGLAYADPADPTGATCLPTACTPGTPGCN